MTVAEMLDRMTKSELNRWIWHFELHPFGSVGDDSRLLDVLTHITNIVQQIYAKKGKKPKQQDYNHYTDRLKRAIARMGKKASSEVQDAWGEIFGDDNT